MKKFLVILNIMIWTFVTTEVRAGDREVFGAVIGAVIGYQIAKATAPQPQIVHQQAPIYQDHRTNRVIDLRHPQPQSNRCWTRLDRINSYGQPIYMQECHVN
jgi:hypothetical protein